MARDNASASTTTGNARSAQRGSPLRRQYESLKAQFPDGILLFRLGDFYETFGDDAVVAARDLDIALTSKELGRGDRVPLAGVPAHSLDANIARLLEKGHRVAICEQFGDPKASKGIMERDIVRVVTPGTVVEPGLLPGTANNFLAAVVTDYDRAGLAYVDITTSEFVTLELPTEALPAELESLSPAELLTPAPPDGAEDAGEACVAGDRPVTPIDASLFDVTGARQRLMAHFGGTSLDAYGCENLPRATAAAGAVLAYLQDTQRGGLMHITSLRTRSVDETMILDAQTVRTLELFEGVASGTREGSLLGLLDLTESPMGARMLRQWIGRPLLNLNEITARLDGVESLLTSGVLRARLRAHLHGLPDVERLINRIRSGNASPRDLVALRRGLDTLAAIRDALTAEAGDDDAQNPLAWARQGIGAHESARALLHEAIAAEPGAALTDGGVVRRGFSEQLDALREVSLDARGAIAALEASERQSTGIPSLKVGYSRVFGYYIEVTRSHLPRVPEAYIRKQTVANGERFFTPALKELEERISSAQERAEELESAIFRQICGQVTADDEAVLDTARAVARLDLLAAFAENAARWRLTRPVLDDSRSLDITGARHPVVESYLDEPFVPNDARLTEQHPIAILTGPNMAGKSTYLRQVALVVLMAQIGSFVPAQSARVGIVDRIFTRAGLQDDISTGRSTFMVEMTETAMILHHATSRSLIVLDEIGRGTSTYDGLAIAWAVVEHIHNNPRLGARTLFATHYHELVELGATLPKASNIHVLVSEEEGKVVFLRQVAPGGADRSYGVHVAQLAGLPRDVVGRAREVLSQLESVDRTGSQPASAQPSLFALQDASPAGSDTPSPVEAELRKLAPDQMTPLEALAKLYDLQRMAGCEPPE